VGSLLEKIGLDRWLEENLVDSLHRFQTQIEAEVRRQADASSHPAPSEVFHRENVCN
jgi:hypothetical protein